VQALAKPRAVVIMVAAGRGVDDTIDKLLPHLAPGDALIDGGNSYYEDTERRVRELAAKGVLFLGMGAPRPRRAACARGARALRGVHR
jgi:6-phosphogluconate dehydrogenase